eukprot:TRINITY_DN57875_c0_g1_i1.p1 TRINITY_DN57875_c0_g1~~TRINITY_DN57875_c0_g1_i1.p1  ORF type:complete len:301 (-),score=43.53 TRINITY_DN57875_c0_g1_i1:21-923(-)
MHVIQGSATVTMANGIASVTAGGAASDATNRFFACSKIDSPGIGAGYSPGSILQRLARVHLPPPIFLGKSEAAVGASEDTFCTSTHGEESTRSSSGSSVCALDALGLQLRRPAGKDVATRSDTGAAQDLETLVYGKAQAPNGNGGSPKRPQQQRGRPSAVPKITDGVTTLMVRNLPENITQKDLVAELNDSGFLGAFDFCYMPSTFRTGRGKSYAFINFISDSVARSFALTWHLSRHFGMTDGGSLLTIAVAEVQGIENMLHGKASNRNRIRNPSFRPYIAETAVARLPKAFQAPLLQSA